MFKVQVYGANPEKKTGKSLAGTYTLEGGVMDAMNAVGESLSKLSADEQAKIVAVRFENLAPGAVSLKLGGGDEKAAK